MDLLIEQRRCVGCCSMGKRECVGLIKAIIYAILLLNVVIFSRKRLIILVEMPPINFYYFKTWVFRYSRIIVHETSLFTPREKIDRGTTRVGWGGGNNVVNSFSSSMCSRRKGCSRNDLSN